MEYERERHKTAFPLHRRSMGSRRGRVREPQSVRHARYRRQGPGWRQIHGKCRGFRGESRISSVGQRESRSALGSARQGRLAHHGACRRPRPFVVARGRQDLSRGQGRSHARRAHLQVFRRRGAAPSRRDRRFDASWRRGGDLSRTARRLRIDNALELSHCNSGMEERACAAPSATPLSSSPRH